MIRTTLLWLVIIALCFYARRDWFKPMCMLIVLMPLYGHPDMPSNLFGLQGLNPWNGLLLAVVLGYLGQKRAEGSKWDLDPLAATLLAIYVGLMVISFLRVYGDYQALEGWTGGDIVSEYLINAVKWLAPAFLVYVGARTDERKRLVLWAVFAANLYVALMVFRRVPLSTVTNGFELTQTALKVLEEVFGWSRVNVAMVLAGASWATLFSLGYLLRGRFPYLPLVAFGLLSMALALTGGRTGWGVWLALALLFSVTKYRKGLLLIPVVIVAVVTLVPSVSERLLQGTASDDSGRGLVVSDVNAVTSGRTSAWPVVIDRINERPWFGYGRQGMIRSGAAAEVSATLGLDAVEGDRGFGHPHNAYLLMLLDSGWIGAVPVFILWLLVLYRAVKICDKRDKEAEVIGMTTLSLVLGVLIAGVGSQDLYPTTSTVTVWAAIGLTLRVYADKYRLVRAAVDSEPAAPPAPAPVGWRTPGVDAPAGGGWRNQPTPSPPRRNTI